VGTLHPATLVRPIRQPLKAILDIMAYGNHDGQPIMDPAIRQLFCRTGLLKSDWYRRRMIAKQQRDIEHWQTHSSLWIAVSRINGKNAVVRFYLHL